MVNLTQLFVLDFYAYMSFVLGKWDSVTGINSPLYRSHTEVENQEDWKNTVREKNFSF